MAVASAELVAVFGIIVLVTGPLWARVAWGVWWQWEARLTSTLVLWMIFMAYCCCGGTGAGIGPAGRGTRAVRHGQRAVRVRVGELLAHPAPEDQRRHDARAGMRPVFWWCVFAFLLLYAGLIAARMRLEEQRATVDELYLALED